MERRRKMEEQVTLQNNFIFDLPNNKASLEEFLKFGNYFPASTIDEIFHFQIKKRQPLKRPKPEVKSRKAYHQEYYVKNKEKIDSGYQKWYEANKENRRAYNREYYKKNKKRLKQERYYRSLLLSLPMEKPAPMMTNVRNLMLASQTYKEFLTGRKKIELFKGKLNITDFGPVNIVFSYRAGKYTLEITEK